MHTLRLLYLASIFCLFSVSALAQQTTSTSSPPATSDPQAVALVQQSLVALVGKTTVSDVTLTGTANRIAGSDDETGTATLTAMAAGESELNLNLPSGQLSEIRNSVGTSPGAPAGYTARVGAWSGPDGTIHMMASHNLLTDPTWFFPAFTLGNLASSQAYVLSYVGQGTLNGQAVLHISAAEQFPLLSSGPLQGLTLMQHLSQMELYLNATTLLPVALDFNTHPDNNAGLDIPIQIQFSNYQSVNGVQVPLHLQKYLNNGLILDLQFSNATLDSGLIATAFQIP